MTPTGVEHNRQGLGCFFMGEVNPSMTPTGVEHATKTAIRAIADRESLYDADRR